jgi:hypothetical protein
MTIILCPPLVVALLSEISFIAHRASNSVGRCRHTVQAGGNVAQLRNWHLHTAVSLAGQWWECSDEGLKLNDSALRC